jgi:hypothetical protein
VKSVSTGSGEQSITLDSNYTQTKADKRLLQEAEAFVAGTSTDRKSRHLHSKKLVYDPSEPTGTHHLEEPTPAAERPIVAKYSANPPVKRKSQFEEYRTKTHKRLIKPGALGFLTPCGNKEQYSPRNTTQTKSVKIKQGFGRILGTISETNNRDFRGATASGYSSENSSPETELFRGANRFQDTEFEPGVRRLRVSPTDHQHHASSDSDSDNSPELELDIVADFNAALDLDDLDYEEELILLEHPQEEGQINIEEEPINNMALPPNDLPGIIQQLQGDNNADRQNAIVHLAQYVQRINPPARAQPPPARITLRDALENVRAGAADQLKVTDLMPDS